MLFVLLSSSHESCACDRILIVVQRTCMSVLEAMDFGVVIVSLVVCFIL